MKNLTISFIAVLFLTSIAFASVDSVIVATDASNIDAMVAAAAGHKSGYPVLITSDNAVDQGMVNKFLNIGVKNVAIVGGPLVVTSESEDALKANFNVTRLWGVQRTQTSLEVAEYFWLEGSDCAVLVDDTKNSDADHKLHRQALGFAVSYICPLIPVPVGSVPSEVLLTLKDLNVSKVYYVAVADSQAVRDALADFTIDVSVGKEKDLEKYNDNEAEERAEKDGKKLKLVIVAAPDWRLAIGISSHPRDHSVVRFVESDSNLNEIIDFIRSKNITDVKVVGKPELAQSVAAKLLEAGINATKVSGEKASDVSKDLLDNQSDKWFEKREKAKAKLESLKTKLKEKLLDRLVKLEEMLDNIEAELQGSSDSSAAAEVQAKIDITKARIAEIRAKIEANSEEGKRLLNSLKSDVHLIRYNLKARLGIDEDDEIENEEDTNEELKERFDFNKVEERLSGDCKTRVLPLLERSKDLLNQANEALELNDTSRAAQLYKEAHKAFNAAKRVSQLCVKGERLSERIDKILSNRTEKLERMIDKNNKPMLRILAPTPKQTIVGPVVKVNVWASGVTLVPAPGSGLDSEAHFHVYMDEVEQRGAKREFTFENVSSGNHTIIAELHQNDHTLIENTTVVRQIVVLSRSGQKEFSVDASDSGFVPNGLKVPSNEKIKLNFRVTRSSYGGMRLKGPNFDDSKIAVGVTVSKELTLSEDAIVSAYWPSSEIKKGDLKLDVE